ncbi:MAG TPA: response regulator [Patescibacteria group bacterium]|nr:response regulator [Patescibacteria group bacterium]
MRILVVDDSKVTRDMIIMYLRKAGFTDVDEAKDGAEALLKVRNLSSDEKYDVITLDVNMPKMDGVATLRELRQMGCMSKIIMCSTQNDMRTVKIGIGFGIDGYIVKPFTAEKLMETLWASLGKT